CNYIILGHQISHHLREFHGIQGADHVRVDCSWDYCDRTISKENLARHVQEAHRKCSRAHTTSTPTREPVQVSGGRCQSHYFLLRMIDADCAISGISI
ncbi:hypothetical protein CY34DRAFT_99819, partial [Suillus luteus UH-Slu-Lm8-n1]